VANDLVRWEQAGCRELQVVDAADHAADDARHARPRLARRGLRSAYALDGAAAAAALLRAGAAALGRELEALQAV
jgi:hypothetical protein